MKRLLGILLALFLTTNAHTAKPIFTVAESLEHGLKLLLLVDPEPRIGPMRLKHLIKLAPTVKTIEKKGEPELGSGEKKRRAAKHFVKDRRVIINVDQWWNSGEDSRLWTQFHEGLGALGFDDENYQLTTAAKILHSSWMFLSHTADLLNAKQAEKEYRPYFLAEPDDKVGSRFPRVRKVLGKRKVAPMILTPWSLVFVLESYHQLKTAKLNSDKEKTYEIGPEGVSSVGGGGDWHPIAYKTISGMQVQAWAIEREIEATQEEMAGFARFFFKFPFEVNRVEPARSVDVFLENIVVETEDYGRVVKIPDLILIGFNVPAAKIANHILDLLWKEFQAQRD